VTGRKHADFEIDDDTDLRGEAFIDSNGINLSKKGRMTKFMYDIVEGNINAIN